MIRQVIRFEPKIALIFLFAALGPLGNVFTPNCFPKSFRTYYFLLPLFPIFFSFAKERFAKICIIFAPFLIYALISSFLVERFDLANESHPLFRFFLLVCQFFFVIGGASSLKTNEQLTNILKTYLRFFFFSLGIGYFFFFGFYLHMIPFSVIQKFSILTQFGWNLLRLSPGSYANEYGTVASFVLSILMIIYFEQKQAAFGFSKIKFSFFFLATFLALLLTTTRAAYLSFFASFLYLSIKEKKFLKLFSYSFIFSLLSLRILKYLNIDMFTIFKAGFSQRINEGSLGERYAMWQNALGKIKGHGFLGVGFASLTNVHNVYIQLLFELGFIGSFLLIASIALAIFETFSKYQKATSDTWQRFYQKIQIVGLINVFSFAASNHNLNHHLSWFVFFLCLAKLHLWTFQKTATYDSI